MARSRAMRSAVSGWVENIRITVRPENGLTGSADGGLDQPGGQRAEQGDWFTTRTKVLLEPRAESTARRREAAAGTAA
jgi:hypothetical protein